MIDRLIVETHGDWQVLRLTPHPRQTGEEGESYSGGVLELDQTSGCLIVRFDEPIAPDGGASAAMALVVPSRARVEFDPAAGEIRGEDVTARIGERLEYGGTSLRTSDLPACAESVEWALLTLEGFWNR